MRAEKRAERAQEARDEGAAGRARFESIASCTDLARTSRGARREAVALPTAQTLPLLPPTRSPCPRASAERSRRSLGLGSRSSGAGQRPVAEALAVPHPGEACSKLARACCAAPALHGAGDPPRCRASAAPHLPHLAARRFRIVPATRSLLLSSASRAHTHIYISSTRTTCLLRRSPRPAALLSSSCVARPPPPPRLFQRCLAHSCLCYLTGSRRQLQDRASRGCELPFRLMRAAWTSLTSTAPAEPRPQARQGRAPAPSYRHRSLPE